MNSDKKFVTLNNGAKMPTIGMGTWHHGPREEIDAALRQEINTVNSVYTVVDFHGVAGNIKKTFVI